jgi:hypothetical protein
MDKGRSSIEIEVSPEGNITYYTAGLSDFEKSGLNWY